MFVNLNWENLVPQRKTSASAVGLIATTVTSLRTDATMLTSGKSFVLFHT